MPSDLESVIAEALYESGVGGALGYYAESIVAAVREYLLSEESVERAAKADYELTNAEPWSIGTVPMDEAQQWLEAARAALSAALGEQP